MNDTPVPTPSEIAEQVRRMVAGEGVVFADLFAVDGVLEYPFACPANRPDSSGGKPSAGTSPTLPQPGPCSGWMT